MLLRVSVPWNSAEIAEEDSEDIIVRLISHNVKVWVSSNLRTL